jgi:RNA polymerase sigma-70 factor (ECF subfamily)
MSVELIAALKARDPAAFKQLLSEHGAMIYRVALRLMRSKEDAEDVLQETVMRVYEKIHTFEERSALTSWLYRIVSNAALTRLRIEGRGREVPLGEAGPWLTEDGRHARDVADWTPSSEDALLRREALSAIREAVQGLPDTYRSVYVLAEIEDLSHQEVAALLDLQTGTVKVRLHRARLFLRQALADYFEERRPRDR